MILHPATRQTNSICNGRKNWAEWTTRSIDASAANSNEALKSTREACGKRCSAPVFRRGKGDLVSELQFLADERTALANAVTESLGDLAQEFKEFPFGNVRLLISAGKVDKRKVFYKAIDKLGTVEAFAGLSVDDKDWADQAEIWARKQLRTGRRTFRKRGWLNW